MKGPWTVTVTSPDGKLSYTVTVQAPGIGLALEEALFTWRGSEKDSQG